MMTKGRIVIISGPSGSGKTTLCSKVLSDSRFQGKLVRSISATTRPRRSNEEHGRDYLFMTPEEFQRQKREGGFLESESVFGNSYGTPKKNIEDLLRRGVHVVLAIDVKGAKTVVKQYPDALKIFIQAPSLDVLEKRLTGRASENKDDQGTRLKTARQEMTEAKNYQYTVINDDLAKAYQHLTEILSKELGL